MTESPEVLDVLLRWEELRASGQDATAEDLCSDRPDLLEAVRAALEQLRRINRRLEVAADELPSSPPDGKGTQPSVAESTRTLTAGPQHTPRWAKTPHSSQSATHEFLSPPQGEGELGRLGRYRVLKQLGQGGMGMVLLAEDLDLRRLVALKVILPQDARNPLTRQRFLREARAAAKLKHDNVVTVYQVGEESGVLFIAMELLEGTSLDNQLRTGPQLSIDDVIRLAREMVAGLGAAHAVGLIHRDIKPANIWLESVRTGEAEVSKEPACAPFRVKILDFGLARDQKTDQLTNSGAVIGTPKYMSPEQADGKPLDARSDLFSIGVVLYRLCTGKEPFTGPSTLAVLKSLAVDTPSAVRHLNPEAPRALSRLIDQLLAKEPEKRPASASAVAEALRAIDESRREAARPRPSRRRVLLATGAAAIAGSGLAAALISWQARPPLPEKPGDVAIDFDEPGLSLALRRGDEPETIIPANDAEKHSLPPGNYRIQLTEARPERRLVPDELVVRPGETQTLMVRLVGEVRSTGKSFNSSVKCVGVVPAPGELTIAAVSLDSSLGLWRPLAAPPSDGMKFFDAPAKPVQFQTLAAAPDGRLVAAGGGSRTPRMQDFSILLFDLTTSQWVEPMGRHASWVDALAFSPDGKLLLSGGRDGSLFLWEVADRNKTEWKGHSGLGVKSVAFSSDAKQALSAGGDPFAILWDVKKGAEIKRLQAGSVLRCASFGPGISEAVTAGDDGVIRIWDLAGDKRREFQHQGGVLSIAISPDGNRLLSGGKDGTIRLWEVQSGKEVEVFRAGEQGINSVAFTADVRRAVSGGADHTLRLWQLPP